MTNHEMRETIRQMLADWEAATPEQRAAALEASAIGARKAEARAAMCACCEQCGSQYVAHRDDEGGHFCSRNCMAMYWEAK